MTTATQTNLINTGSLVLVNAKHPLHTGLANPELSPLMADATGETLLAYSAAKMLDFTLAACGGIGRIRAVSGYRSREEQQQIYADSLRENGPEHTARFVALPGHSEHESGLAIDLSARGAKDDIVCPSLPHTGVFNRFRAIAPRYGFVERYGKSKTHITGIGYEPWHFRFVGWPHASLMQKNGLCLEEYIALLQTHEGLQNALELELDGRRLAIFTEHADRLPVTEQILRGKKRLWQTSGNNIDGVVVTVWL